MVIHDTQSPQKPEDYGVLAAMNHERHTMDNDALERIVLRSIMDGQETVYKQLNESLPEEEIQEFIRDCVEERVTEILEALDDACR